ncbi:MAG TPA: hypothetical protein VFC16_13010, partial [Nakamurella sp.]|nr:hypothetical protein [Nakamurella sp.]
SGGALGGRRLADSRVDRIVIDRIVIDRIVINRVSIDRLGCAFGGRGRVSGGLGAEAATTGAAVGGGGHLPSVGLLCPGDRP